MSQTFVPDTLSSNRVAPVVAKPKPAVPPAPVKPKVVQQPPSGPPVPPLAKLGFWGGIDDFAARVTQVTLNHERTRGYRPKPDEVLKAALQPEFRPDTLTAPVRAVPVSAPTDAEIVKRIETLAAAIPVGGFKAATDLHDYLKTVDTARLQKDKKFRGRVNAAVLKASGFGDTPNLMGKAISQVAMSLVHTPEGLLQMGVAADQDIAAALGAAGAKVGIPRSKNDPQPSFKFERTRKIAGGMGAAVAEDVRHPLENPGFLFLDALGVASLGAAGVTKLGAAARAEGVAGKTGALLTKPELRRKEVRVGDYTEEALLSSNPLVAAVQSRVLDARMKAADASTAPLTSILFPEWLGSALMRNVSIERKVGRESEARLRTEYEAKMAIVHELNQVAGRARLQSRIFGRIPVTTRKGLTRGEQKAIQIASWDVEGGWAEKAAAERAFHERMIELGVGSKRAHEGQIADIALAEKAMGETPAPVFTTRVVHVTTPQSAAQIRNKGFNVARGKGLGGDHYGPGIYLTDEASDTASFWRQQLETKNERGTVPTEALTGTVSLHKPFEYETIRYNRVGDATGRISPREVIEQQRPDLLAKFGAAVAGMPANQALGKTLREAGYDGLIIRHRQGQEIIAFKGDLVSFDGAKKARKQQQRHRPRFTRALELTREVVAESERMRIENLGLLPMTAAGRVAKPGVVFAEGATIAQRVKLASRLSRLEGLMAHAQKKGILDEPLSVGTLVRPSDRGNLGRITEIAGDQAQVHFRNKATGLEETVSFPLSSLRHNRDYTDEIAKLREQLAELPDPLAGKLPRQSEDSFYLPTQPRGKVKRPPSSARGYFSPSAGPFGVPPGRKLPELTHEFTGKALQAGDYRIDATSLAAEAYARTVRAVTVRNQHQKLWDAGHKTGENIPEQFRVAVRDVNEIPDKLRELVAKLDEGAFTSKDAELLPKDMATLIEALYPNPKNLSPEEIKHVRWVDERVIPQSAQMSLDPAWAKTAQALNSPFRFLALYARPAYALNLLGNAAMLWFDQGVAHSIQNVARAAALEKIYGVRNAETIRALVGQGRSESYVTSKSGALSQRVAHGWNRVTDRDMRVASFLYYAERKGVRSPDEMQALLNDKTKAADLNEVKRRANKALVEFDNLTPLEKSTIRHLIFVYPWVRGSAIWSLRAIAEHPAKTAILAHLGQEAMQEDPFFKRAPEWFRRTGYIPVGWNSDGTPKVVNPTSVNTFSTLAEFAALGKAQTTGDKYASVSELFGPAAEFFTRWSTGRDQYGNEYPGSDFLGAAREVLADLPQLRGLRDREEGPQKPFDIRRRQSLEASLNDGLDRSVFSPGWLEGYGSLIAGGFNPRGVDKEALEARYWQDQDVKVRHGRELDLLNTALNRQAKFLGRDVPPDVRKAIRAAADVTFLWGQQQDAMGTEPTERIKTDFYLDYFKSKGLITDSELKKLKAEMGGLVSEDDWKSFRAQMAYKYAGGKQVAQWDDNVALLYSFKKDTFDRKAASLFEQGLSPQRTYRNVPQEKLTEYGRKYLAFTEKVRELKAKDATPDDLRLFEDDHSDPVDGLPSFAAMAWANQKPEDQKRSLYRLATQSWATMTRTEKRVLGLETPKGVTEAWRAYRLVTSKEALAKQLPPGQRSLDKDQRLAVVKQLDRYYELRGAFLKDYLFSEAPNYQRVKYTTLVTKSPHKDDWAVLFAQADRLTKAVKDEQTTQRVANDAWQEYTRKLVDYYQAENPAFYRELKPILDANPTFLEGLVD